MWSLEEGKKSGQTDKTRQTLSWTWKDNVEQNLLVSKTNNE